MATALSNTEGGTKDSRYQVGVLDSAAGPHFFGGTWTPLAHYEVLKNRPMRLKSSFGGKYTLEVNKL